MARVALYQNTSRFLITAFEWIVSTVRNEKIAPPAKNMYATTGYAQWHLIFDIWLYRKRKYAHLREAREWSPCLLLIEEPTILEPERRQLVISFGGSTNFSQHSSIIYADDKICVESDHASRQRTYYNHDVFLIPGKVTNKNLFKGCYRGLSTSRVDVPLTTWLCSLRILFEIFWVVDYRMSM